MAQILDGKKLSKIIEEELKIKVNEIKKELHWTPKLATILVGDNPASQTYVRMKVKACERVGLKSEQYILDKNSTTEDVLNLIEKLNKSKKVCGILLQHPVPSHIDEQACFNAISMEKDVDGVNSASYFLSITVFLSKYVIGCKYYVQCTINRQKCQSVNIT